MKRPAAAPAAWPLSLRLLALIAAGYLAIGVGLRLLLWYRFGVPAQVALGRLPAILGSGAVNDAQALCFLLLPLSLLLLALPRGWQGPRRRVLLFGTFAAALFGLLFLAALEYFFFEEFDARLNLVAVDYLIYPTEVVGNIGDTYPVGPLSAALAALALLAAGALWPLLGLERAHPAHRGQRRRVALAHALVAGAVFTTGASVGTASDNRVAGELAANGPARFFEALRTNHLEYPAYYRTGDPERLRERLRQDLGRGGGEFRPQAQGLARAYPARAGVGRLNVVVLSEESFGAEFVGAYGDVRGLTPEFDALAREGLLFTRAYATGTRTVRGLEAITASFPPVPSESILKRPGSERIATWGSVMRELGYHTSFLYGGYGTFDSMNAFYGGNGYEVRDRTDMPKPRFANIWGVSDEDLFDYALEYFDRRAAAGQPFFSIVMSTSNHKPFTFPEGVPGVPPRGGGRAAGIRYADHAIGGFFRAARARPWFRDTLFVVVADHGARVYGAAQIPLHSYEIPLLVLAPGRIPPAGVDTPTSQIDIAPTVLGLLGLPYQAPFFGQDVLHWAGGPRTLLFNHNHSVALFRDGHLAILDLQRKLSCERYEREAGSARRDGDRFIPEGCDPDLVALATAYYQTGYELFTQHAYQ
ncbi:MAG: LTA synthase family protein [Gammaproteobacteria bacterium]|nr:LTA synthase family protein [Gammaproteobacteria bacterium]